ncbi:group II intron maturase-specific domain-containing protein [Streptomyces sp. TX20-6-3]|uniref:group II intron maturase-specific domain-containing protein n=1 Tax=Streptomyces sp. TX20-6-3 TaxID=3028705 RepID=UPI0029B6FF26|nr:group II intron maturase-specific domain-containing protein [Streptomyces sp. TX20-6-3]MDX2565150.1 group II intron maturase-specific domain-containing protein [Streptomyces sp. TX20-6-3]
MKAFLKAGILTEGGSLKDSSTGTPQGGILSPLLANIALTVLDEYVANRPGGPSTTPARRERHRKRGTDRQYVYTYPAKKSVRTVARKIKTVCRTDVNQPLPVLLRQLNSMLRGWCAYFRPGVSSATFQLLRQLVWGQTIRWIRRKHRRITWKDLRRRYCNGGWWPTTGDITLFDPAKVRTTRYRYRGAVIPSPGPPGLLQSRMSLTSALVSEGCREGRVVR